MIKNLQRPPIKRQTGDGDKGNKPYGFENKG
jgi:hypothetical protein